MLRLVNIRVVNPAPGIPPSTENEDIQDMYEDLMRGLEEMLGK